MDNQNKPREEWDEDELADGRPNTREIEVLVFAPAKAPELRTIPNTLDGLRALVGGHITMFTTGIEGTIGVCHDEGVLLNFPPCRFIEATGYLIFGTFFVAGNGVNLHSLRPTEIKETTRVLGPPLTLEQVMKALAIQDETDRLIAEWNWRNANP